MKFEYVFLTVLVLLLLWAIVLFGIAIGKESTIKANCQETTLATSSGGRVYECGDVKL